MFKRLQASFEKCHRPRRHCYYFGDRVHILFELSRLCPQPSRRVLPGRLMLIWFVFRRTRASVLPHFRLDFAVPSCQHAPVAKQAKVHDAAEATTAVALTTAGRIQQFLTVDAAAGSSAANMWLPVLREVFLELVTFPVDCRSLSMG